MVPERIVFVHVQYTRNADPSSCRGDSTLEEQAVFLLVNILSFLFRVTAISEDALTLVAADIGIATSKLITSDLAVVLATVALEVLALRSER